MLICRRSEKIVPMALDCQFFFVTNSTIAGSGSFWEKDLNITLVKDNGHALHDH